MPQARGHNLTFAERVAYQHAIEEVYWRHRIWPRSAGENPAPKPPLDAIVSQRQIEHKVEEHLRKSQLVADRRGSPITGSELQTEMERMAHHTRQPEVLGELFQALGNDPFVVAECLATPILAERLASSPRAYDGARAPATATALKSETYKLPEISFVECADNWTPTTIVNAPVAREGHNAVWTGSEMIVWGGYDGMNMDLNTGAKYQPATDSWTATSIANAPDVRWLHSTVWTGIEMIVWGGANFNGRLSTGGRYDPITDTWTATSLVNVPMERNYHTAVWTGSEMIIWGGSSCGGNCKLNTGGRYNPTTDSWTGPTSTVSAPIPRFVHAAVWTGSEMIIWGGSDSMNYLHTGGRYNPSTNSWTPTGLTNVPLGRAVPAVWTGSEMIVWGGVDETINVTNTGGRYNPSTDSWILTTTVDAPLPRGGATGVWTGSEMIVWGGNDTSTFFNTGGRYNAGTDSWRSTTTDNAPSLRFSYTAVWTGSQMIIWGGGSNVGIALNTGGIYCAQSSPTPTPTATATATPTSTPTPTPTATSNPTPTPTASPTPTLTPGVRAINLSTRLLVGTGNDVGIGGLIVSGTGPRHVLLRGIGPSLSGLIPAALPDPVLELHGPAGFQTITNNNWKDTQQAAIEATGLAPSNDLESAILVDLAPGAYTAILSGNAGVVGVGLVEVYDLSMNEDSKLGNISTRGFVSTGDEIMIAGFILAGNNGADNIIVRGIGPSLTPFGVPNALADPMLELRNSNGALIRANNDWMDDPAQKALITAAGLAPANNFESALYETLAPGQYTALLSGVNMGTGVGLVEAYDLGASGPVATPTPGGTATPSATPGGTPSPTPAVSPSPLPTPVGPCTENWDSVTAPALPQGWVASNPDPGDGVLWATTTAMSESAPNNAFIRDQDGISDKVLDRGGVNVTSANATLSFRNNFNTEFSSGILCDGYVLEVSAPNISGGQFLDITNLQVGGSFAAGGYTVLMDCPNSPIAGRMAWAGNSNGYIDTVINLGPNLVGQTVTFRFRLVTDEAIAAPGVHIDNLVFTDASCP